MKKLIALILAVILCLSFTGCSEEEQTQIELYLKYADIINALENKDYNQAINQIGGMIREEQKLSEGPRPAALDVLCGTTWYARITDDKQPPLDIRIANDGTCTVDGQAMTWLEMSSGDEYITIVLLDNGAHKYVVSLSAETVTRPRMTLYASGMNEYGYFSDQYIANYFTHANVSDALVYWRQAGRTDELPSSFNLSDYNCYIFDAYYNWEIIENTDDSLLTMTVFSAEGDSDTTYTLRLQDRNGIYVLLMTQDGTDIEATYYCENYGLDDTWVESIYGLARNQLDRYLNNSNNTLYINETSLTANQSRAYLHDLFSKAASYRDGAEYLARFSTIPTQLVKLSETTVDQLDKSNTNRKAEYFYNPDGTLSRAYGDAIIEAYGVYYSDTQHFFYDENGKISKIIAGYNIDNPSAIGIPEYDADGRLVAMAVQTSSDSYTSTFTYDDAGHIVTADIYPGDYYGRNITYTYDDAGRLIQKVTLRQNGYYTYTEDYTYEDDMLTHILETYARTNGKNIYTTEYAITNDSQGRPVSVVITTTNPNYTYKSTTREYHYEDLYFLDTTGLLDETN